jgi:hypothetical protein
MQEFLNSTRRSISWLKQMHDLGALDVKPPFQRNPVWTPAQRSFLIDTILRGYPIPELYIQESVDDKGKEKHVIVDGQQRVRACLSFVGGEYSLDAETVPEWPDATIDDLTPEEKKKIFGYSFIVRQLPDVPDETLRVIFGRLNRNVVALNKQELRHATYWGPFIKSMEAIADDDYWVTSGIFTANDIRRMLDIEFISEIAVAILHGIPNKKATLDRWYEVYEEGYPDRAQVESTFRTVLGELTHLLPEISRTRWRKKSDFYSLFIVLAAHVDSLPLSKAKRAKAGKDLVSFGEAVDEHLKTEKSGTVMVKRYSAAVERAASDLKNRLDRDAVLEELLAENW